MGDDRDGYRELPACPNCGTKNTVQTPAAEHDYQCLECGTEFDEGGRGVIVQ